MQRQLSSLQVQSHFCPPTLSFIPIWDAQLRSIPLVWDRKGSALLFFFFALCIAFVPSLTLNSRAAELSLPLVFFPLSSPWLLLYIRWYQPDLSMRVPQVHKILGIQVGLTSKTERKKRRKEGREYRKRELNTSKHNIFALPFVYQVQRVKLIIFLNSSNIIISLFKVSLLLVIYFIPSSYFL